MERIILKLGGSVITKKDSVQFPMRIDEIKKRADEYIKLGNVRRFGHEIAEALKIKNIQFVLINGVGPFGHFLVKNWDKLDDKAIVHESVKCLNERLIEIMRECGLNIKPFAPFDARRPEGTYSMYKIWGVGAVVLDNGEIFSTYGDIVPDSESKYGYRVVSGDDLAVEIAKLWEPDKIIMATDVDGIFTENPHADKNAKLIKTLRSDEKEFEKLKFSKNRAIDISGEMKGKVSKLLKSGVKSQIVNGLVAGNVKSALLGDESIGTIVIPKSK